MVDPATVTLSSIGAEALKEGIKFLYGQAAEVLKRWRSHRDKATHDNDAAHAATEPIAVKLPGVFVGELRDPEIHFDAVATREGELLRVFKELSSYASEIQPMETTNVELLGHVADLRAILEAVYRQHITFVGEQRPASGAILSGSVRAKAVAGEATGLEAEGKIEGEARGQVDADRVEPGGKATGLKWKSR
jgi:hypothetical protein